MAASQPLTAHDLTRDLAKIGVKSGDTLFVHSSLRAVGPVLGGAAGVIRALEVSVGPAGTILLPSFNLATRTQAERAAVWDPATTRSTVGWLTEYFRTMDGTVRSDHPSHSVAARGARARGVCPRTPQHRRHALALGYRALGTHLWRALPHDCGIQEPPSTSSHDGH